MSHDILIDRLKRRIGDAGVIRLIRAYLNAGIMDGGVVVDRHLGTPQGGPLSPLLANVLLDEVDKALEARGHSFARYADDCNVYVGSQQAGERVMAYLRTLYAGLKLQVNEAKSAVASVFGRKFLGYALWVAKGCEVKCKVADKPLQNFKARIRQLTRRSCGRSLAQVVEKLRPYLLGWKAYFGLAQTPPAVALEAAQDDLPGTQDAGGGRRCRQTGGGQLSSVVAQQCQTAQQRADHCVL